MRPVFKFSPLADEHKIQPLFGGDLMIKAAVAEKQGGVLDGALV